jgi:uncharacterized repeat protein (TIGR03803 family)
MSKRWLNFVFVVLLCASAVSQNNFKVLHSFSGYPNDGAHSISDVAFDSKGNLYGTTAGGGSGYGCGDNGCGTVFELSPQQDGTWQEMVIHNFCSDYNGQACLDGAYGYAGLVIDRKGNLYGTTLFGGPNCVGGCSGAGGGGLVFELSPPSAPGGTWTETVLYNFCAVLQGMRCLDGEEPTSQLIFDAAGNLYGTTAGGGSGHILGAGTVFELSPGAGGWKETILYNFCSQGSGNNCPDGYEVAAGVTFDAEGNIYGTTTYSGNDQAPAGGTVYELVRQRGSWQYNELLDVPANSKGYMLEGTVSFDQLGNLFSTFSRPNGGIFGLNPKTGKTEVLTFNGGTGGGQPYSGLLIDPTSRAAYGAAGAGGSEGAGTVFRVSSIGKENVLHTFCSWSECDDGETPDSSLVPGITGDLYGTTEFGGTYGNGVVFEVTP